MTEEVMTKETVTTQELTDTLTSEEKSKALQLAQTLDVATSDSVLTYGADAQKNLSAFSQGVLDKVQNQDVGPIGDSLTELMNTLNQASPDDLRPEKQGFFARIFNRVQKSVYEMTAKYQQIGAQVDNVAARLDRHKDSLLADNKMLDGLFQENLDFFNQLNVYIGGAEMKLSDVRQRELPAAQEKARQTNNQLDVQKVQDLVQFEQRLEKRTNDLKLTRQIALQQAPQIRLIQSTNQVLAEKIQASVSTAIPLWKNQVAIALTLLKQKNAVIAQRAVADTTNELLRANADMLHQSAVETAKENERGVVDIKTLQETQNSLIATIQETMQIQRDGRAKRADAEQQMQVMENELKEKLLGMAEEQGRKDIN